MSAFLWAVIAAAVWGVAPVIEKAGLARFNPMVGLFYRSCGVALAWIFLGAALAGTSRLKFADLKTGWILALGGFLASFVGQIAFYNALKTGEVSRVVAVAGAYPLLTFLLGITLFGESISLTKMAGVLCIVAGVWILKA